MGNPKLKADNLISSPHSSRFASRLVFLGAIALLFGCADRPNSKELEAWRKEAIARNVQMKAIKEPDAQRQNWQLAIEGQTTSRTPAYLSLLELNALATTIVRTPDPHDMGKADRVFNFRGVTVSTLLDLFGVDPDVKEVTFVAYDAYRATVSVADLRRYPIIIALERDREKISRPEGGPLYLVFPYAQFPELEKKYNDRYWVFYITGMVVGTESLKLEVRDRKASPEQVKTLTKEALAKLPQATLNEAVGFKIGWPISTVQLHGVRVSDVLEASGIKLPPNGAAIVRGKAAIYRSSDTPIRLEASDIERCSPLLATHWGENRQPIPAKMGGPITLALPTACQSQPEERRWVTFVESLEVAK